MKISSSDNRSIAPQGPGGRANASGLSSHGGRTPGTPSAQVALSPTSRQLLALQTGDHDIDVERVAAIRAAIASGQLQIDPGRIADSLIASARDLLK